MENLSKALENLKSQFPESWLDDIISANSSLEDVLSSIHNHLIKNLEDIFESYNSSILGGEYCDFKGAVRVLSEISSYVEFIDTHTVEHIELSEFDDDLVAMLQEGFRTSFVKVVKQITVDFEQLIREVEAKCSFSEKKILLIQNRASFGFFKSEKLAPILIEEILQFQVNIRLAKLDHGMTFSDSDLKELLEISETLQKGEGKRYTVFLKWKCDFLLEKYMLTSTYLGKSKIYTYRFAKEKAYTINEFDENSIFNTWKQYISLCYEINSNWRQELEEFIKPFRHKKVSELKYTELHALIKFHKDVSPSLSKLKEIRLFLEQKYSEIPDDGFSEFNRYALALAKNFAINNEFSLLCDKPDLEFEDEFERLFDRIIEIQHETGVNNFFVQLKYLKRKLRIINEIYTDKQAIDRADEIFAIYQKCSEVITLYESNVIWAKENYNYVFQIPFEECVIKNEYTDKFSIFLSSSFELPLSQEQYVSEYEALKLEFFGKFQSTNLLKNISDRFISLTLLQNQIEEMQQEASKKDTRTLELLGVFTAIVSFLATSIPSFKFIDNTIEALLFMFSLASSLSLFVLLITWLVNPKRITRKIFGILFLSMFIVWGGLMFIHYQTELFQDEIETEKKKPTMMNETSIFFAPKNVIDNSKNDSIQD